MNLDQFSLNMALRFENDSKTLLGRLNCFDMYLRFYKHGRCMYVPTPFVCDFAYLFYSVELSVSVFHWTGVVMRCQPYGCI